MSIHPPTTDRVSTPASTPKHWYTPLGYAVGTTVTLTAFAYVVALTGGETAAAARETGQLLFAVVSLVGLAVYPALFKDALHLSERPTEWRPAWKAHMSFGLLIPLAVFVVASVQFPARAGELAFLSHAAAATVVSYTYLYRRHRTVGLRSSTGRMAHSNS
ncbi:hypothetical protein [Halomarina oriensis]|uniref:DUF2231 domain-containing protein n=1 Tax=Halomarina oriensis TaxID=671145 RepID=A0A6B0GN89_9EURY|nr:hypothetical protein [Halomarina oriensis]MWG33585.1 hypothetical protein [Halomarina oriensis]